MEIDFPKVVLLVLAVLPGYFALRARKSIAPLSLHKKGATEELAEFLVYSTLAHLILFVLLVCAGMMAGLLLKGHLLFFVRPYLLLSTPELAKRVLTLPGSLILVYLPFSFASGWGIGFARGLVTIWRPFTRVANFLGVTKDSRAGKLWSRSVGRYLLTGRPIIYDVLFPEADAAGTSKLVFVQVVLKDNMGTYIGQVEAFSIARDEEEHKLLYIVDAYRKEATGSLYLKLDVDGVLIDLSQVLTLSVSQTPG